MALVVELGVDRFAVWPVDLGGELAAAASLCSGMHLRAPLRGTANHVAGVLLFGTGVASA